MVSAICWPPFDACFNLLLHAISQIPFARCIRRASKGRPTYRKYHSWFASEGPPKGGQQIADTIRVSPWLRHSTPVPSMDLQTEAIEAAVQPSALNAVVGRWVGRSLGRWVGSVGRLVGGSAARSVSLSLSLSLSFGREGGGREGRNF